MNCGRLMLVCALLMTSSAISQHGARAATFSGATAKGGYKDGPNTEALYERPKGLALRADGSLLVADAGNSRVRVIRGNTTTTFAGSGVSARKDSPKSDAAAFEHPNCLLPLPDGSVLVGDDSRVRIIRSDGSVDTWLDLLGVIPGSPADVTSLAAGTNGTVFVCDRINHRIYARTPDGKRSVLCATDREPQSLAIHPDGRLLVGEYERILAVAPNGTISVFHQADADRDEPLSDLIVAMAFDKRGRLFIADGYAGLLMIKEGRRAVRVPSPVGEVLGLAVSPDDAFAYVTRGDSILRIPLPK